MEGEKNETMDRIKTRSAALVGGLTADEARGLREETTIKLRKQRREEQLRKKRRTGLNVSDVSMDCAGPDLQELLMQLRGWEHRLDAVRAVRVHLSAENDPPIAQVIAAGIVPALVACIGMDQSAEVQYEAAWALTNISGGTHAHTSHVVACDALRPLVQLLDSPNDSVCEQAAWVLGNVAGDSPGLRDKVLAETALVGLLGATRRAAKECKPVGFLRTLTWALQSLTRGRPMASEPMIYPAVPALSKLAWSSDPEVWADAVWGLANLCDGGAKWIQRVLDAGVGPRLLEGLLYSDTVVVLPSLRAIGNILTGTNEQTQALLDLGLLPYLEGLLYHPQKAVRREVCWALSNVAAGTKTQRDALLATKVMAVAGGLMTGAEFEVRREAAHVVANAVAKATPQQVAGIVAVGCVAGICELLKASDLRLINLMLETLTDILRAGEKLVASGATTRNPFMDPIEAAGGLESIEQLQTHVNHEIYVKANTILETFCEVDEPPLFDGGGGMNSRVFGADQHKQPFNFQ